MRKFYHFVLIKFEQFQEFMGKAPNETTWF
jgi:hypothetical protein